MRIWIDLTNSPHVTFFKQMIHELEKEHEFILTCRPLANTIDLLNLYGFPYRVVGRHYGANKAMKIVGLAIRTLQLFRYLRDKKVDVAISHSSFYSPPVSRLLGVRCIYLNDNEYAEGNRISFLFSNKIMIPEFLEIEKVERQWASRKKIIPYPGVKEGIYLWPYERMYSSLGSSKSKSGRKTIFVRPEPWTAQYYRGKRYFIDDLLLALKQKSKIVLLPRGDEQRKHYLGDRFKGVLVPEKSIELLEIMKACDLFIGAGGTMTREAAVLGIPTISIYQDELLDVDKYLIKKGLMVHKRDLSPEFVVELLKKGDRKEPEREMLEKGKEAYELIKSVLLGR